MRVRDVMTRDVVTVTPETPVRDACALLAERGFTMLPVVDRSGTLLGVVTEADALRDRLPIDPRTLVHGEPRRGRSLPRRTVAEVMGEPPVGTAPGTDVADVARRMLEHGVRSAPVVDGKRLVGVITRRDMLRAVSRDDRTLEAEVRHRLGLYADPHRWTVRVVDGRVSIQDELDDERDRHVAAVLAGAVAGVVDVTFPEAERAAGRR
ncbi:HPP family protein [Saccharothrix longispora]|uniref:CBS domain-containing protein n=1 Tax=Saccharothrix longispora TaxID=33920 RepID=A0ABU1PPN5_9PSEU|nr:CBS domain-containing protein [Saccharothrix longispora]MDR6592627.1 CBS domain-containing protein [Saccharothrix longispora]